MENSCVPNPSESTTDNSRFGSFAGIENADDGLDESGMGVRQN
jgi:hypothetical protein